MIIESTTRPPRAGRIGPLLSVVLLAVPVLAQTPPSTFEPRLGQPGKDVIWVPTPAPLVEKMLDLAKVTASDTVIDLGSGDGRLVIAAARRGARAVGIEFAPEMVAISRQRATQAGVADRVRFVEGDLFAQDLSEATVVTMFLLPELNLRLRPRLLRLRPGTRVVSNTFGLGDWVADTIAAVGGECVAWCTAQLWVVPADVRGTWRGAVGTLVLRQDFQVVSGTLTAKDAPVTISRGRLLGDRLSFSVGGVEYAGRVSGDLVEGVTTANGAPAPWTIRRVGGTRPPSRQPRRGATRSEAPEPD